MAEDLSTVPPSRSSFDEAISDNEARDRQEEGEKFLLLGINEEMFLLREVIQLQGEESEE
jgi:hypothetical protein